MEGVSFLNLQYIALAFYNAFTGLTLSALPSHLQSITDTLQAIGIGASLVLLVAIVYAHMRLEQLQIEAKHRRYDAIVEAAGKHGVHNERWAHVISLMTSTAPSDWRNAIIEADIILAELLNEHGVPGETIGEQLKNVHRGSFTTLDLAWEAHKIRNEIAHAGSTYALQEREARRTIDLFRQVFEEFSYI